MNKHDRRAFLKTTAAGAAAFACTFPLRASLSRASIRMGHITDTRFLESDDPEKSGRLHPGWLFGDAYRLAGNLVKSMNSADPPASIIVHTGNVFRTTLFRKSVQAPSRWDRWAAESGARVEAVASGFDKHAARAIEVSGIKIVLLDTGEGTPANMPSRLADRERQLEWLEAELASSAGTPTVIALNPPPMDMGAGSTLVRADMDALQDMMRQSPQVVLVLCGKILANRAGFAPGGNALVLATSSPAFYPCGGRLVDLEVGKESVTIRSSFVQSRLLTLVEKSYHQCLPGSLDDNLGSRADRGLAARAGRIRPLHHFVNPSLAPVWDSRDSITLAVLSDTHITLNEFMSQQSRETYQLIGHFIEDGSKAILTDILEQVARGRHRTEFYDDIFAKDPEHPGNYTEKKVDAVLVTGDLTEHGKRKEAKAFADILAGLPERLREKTMVAFGNHDRYAGDFSPRGPRSSNRKVAEFYSDYLPKNSDRHEHTTYAVRLCEWAALIVLDTSIPSLTPLGLIQDRIDWLEDQLAERKDQAVIVACHHPLYHLTTVPPLMMAYLRMQEHFTPKRSAARNQLHRLFSEHPNVKAVLTGHYHGVVVDRFRKNKTAGSLPDDAYTTHIQVPCTIEYPSAYRLVTLSRHGDRATLDYSLAYTRLFELRAESAAAPIYRYLGTKARPSLKYRRAMDYASRQDNFFGDLARLDGYDLVDLNVRGFKDGTAFLGKGKGGKYNIADMIEFSI